MMPSALGDIEREMAKSYVIVHSRFINARLRDGNLDEALGEARGVVAALERLSFKGGEVDARGAAG